MVVVVGLQESEILWYGLELSWDTPSPPVYHRFVFGDQNGHMFSLLENHWCLALA